MESHIVHNLFQIFRSLLQILTLLGLDYCTFVSGFCRELLVLGLIFIVETSCVRDQVALGTTFSSIDSSAEEGSRTIAFDESLKTQNMLFLPHLLLGCAEQVPRVEQFEVVGVGQFLTKYRSLEDGHELIRRAV